MSSEDNSFIVVETVWFFVIFVRAFIRIETITSI